MFNDFEVRVKKENCMVYLTESSEIIGELYEISIHKWWFIDFNMLGL